MISALLAACAPNVAPATLEAVISVESHGNPLAINVNDGRNPPAATTAEEAATIAQRLVDARHSVDLGLMQVNSKNLKRLGYTVRDMFDPCKAVKAGATVLAESYAQAVLVAQPGQPALKVALSLYNTGTTVYGFKNGYVAQYYKKDKPAEYLNFKPETIREMAGPTGEFKNTDPYKADTEIKIPASYFQQINASR
jgi:type IV secretion system protein VirB1